MLYDRNAFAQLMECKQVREGEIEEYIDDFVTKASMVSVGIAPEIARIDMFINGLSPRIQQFVQLNDPRNLEDAFYKARRVAATLEGSRTNYGVYSSYSPPSQRADSMVRQRTVSNARLPRPEVLNHTEAQGNETQ